MSFLLDALRKSEAQRQRGAPPGLNTPAPESAPPRSRPWPWLVVMVLVAAALIAWWQGWLRPPPPPPTTTETVAPTAESLKPETPPPPGPAAKRSDSGRRPVTPLERFQPPPEAEPRTVEAPPPVQAEPVEPERPATRPPEPAPTPARRDAVDHAELPAEVRQRLPEFRLSVLVWAEDPGGRFILLNGRRQVEGDVIAEGVTLEEIRRDGAVFRHDLYRFVVRR